MKELTEIDYKLKKICFPIEMEKNTYTKEEVQQMIEPLVNQIEFLMEQYSKTKNFIIKNGKFEKIESFVKQLQTEEDESRTLIYEILKNFNSK